MLKGNPKPAAHCSIVPKEHPQHGEDLNVSDNDAGASQRYFGCSLDAVVVEQLRDTVVDDMPQHMQEVECLGGALQAYTPNYFLNESKFRPSLALSNNSPQEVTFHAKFHQIWRHQEVLGEGGDGTVRLYERTEEQGMYVAVKTPRDHSARQDLEKEIANMRLIGRHEHILELCYASKDWYPFGPALFIPYCDLGSLVNYRQLWCEQQAWDGRPERVSEITMWKLFRDMALALNFLHNELGTSYVHNDFKPANVLAITPSDQFQCQMVPEEPTFKLADFARLTPWPTPQGIPAQKYDGTPEYAPPRFEQRAPVQPSADIWGLGATLQYMALGIQPVQSKQAFIRSCTAQGKSHPDLEDNYEWTSEYWRTCRPTVFRPINKPLTVLQKDFDLIYDLPYYQPYGARLGYWYAQLWKPVVTRPKASNLVAIAIPHMDDMVERLKLARLRQIGQF